MINLPDVIPSIIYNNTNAERSIFTSSGIDIPNITGERLYESRSYNERLGKDEFIVAVMYAMSKKIHIAQQQALAEGYTLIIYEGFRPYSVKMKISNELIALVASNSAVNEGLNRYPWNLSWFIATGVSTHQVGCAIDVSLASIGEKRHERTGRYTYLAIEEYTLCSMPTKIHELSAAAISFAYPVSSGDIAGLDSIPLSEGMKSSRYAQYLQHCMMDAGLTPLASEWWHFDDWQTFEGLPSKTNGDYVLSASYSISPK